METNKKSIETVYTYQNDNAKFNITLTMHTDVINSYDFIVQQEDLGNVIERLITSLSEPVGCKPITFEILVFSSIEGTQKLYTTQYSAVIKVTELSFPDERIPFKVLGYPEFKIGEGKSLKKFSQFRY